VILRLHTARAISERFRDGVFEVLYHDKFRYFTLLYLTPLTGMMMGSINIGITKNIDNNNTVNTITPGTYAII